MKESIHKNLHENLRNKIGNAAWTSATSVTKHLLEIGKIEEAKKHIKDIIENWKHDNKIDTINEFKNWVVENDEKKVIDISQF